MAQLKVIISDTFKNLFQPHSKWEMDQLEASVLADPKHERMPPVALWANGPGGANIIVDGNHQYELRLKHKLRTRYEKHYFRSEREAKDWAWRCQAGRRNLNESQMALLVLNDDSSGDLTAAELAKLIGVSERLIQSARKVTFDGSVAVREAVGAGRFTLTDAEKIVDLPKGEQSRLVRLARERNTTLSKQREGRTEARAQPKAINAVPSPDRMSENFSTNGRLGNNGKAPISFDTKELDTALALAIAPKNGESMISGKDRQVALELISKLCRTMKKLDIYDQYSMSLSQMILTIKAL